MTETAPGAEVERRAPTNTLSVMTDGEINRSWRLAEAMAASGAFPEATDAAKAFAVMLIGHDLGMTPTQALMGIHLIKGKPQIAATTLGGFLKARGYDYRVIEHDEERCSIEFGPAPAPRASQKSWPDKDGVSTFTMEDAVKAELVLAQPDPNSEDDEPRTIYKRRPPASEGWEKYPRNMLFARAMSNGVKWYAPDAFGGIPIYTEGDEFEVRQVLTSGEGDGSGLGAELDPKVERVIARATRLGHEGLSSRATVEMTLANRSPEVAREWVAKAEAELDEWEAMQGDEPADVVEPPTPEKLRETAVQLRSDADEAEAEGKEDEALALREQAQETDAQADALAGQS